MQLLYFGHLNISPSPSPFLSLAPVSTLLISTLVHLVSTAAGCVWLCCPLMAPRFTGRVSHAGVPNCVICFLLSVWRLRVGLLKVHELRLVTAKHTTSECYAIRLRAPIVSDGASGSCRRSFPSLASPTESGEDSYCIFNLHTQVVQTPNRRYSSVYQMWRSCTAIQGCCVHRTYCWSCWKWGRSKFSWYKDWKIWQRQPRRKTDGSSSPHTVCWYTYILNLTSCKDAPNSCYRYSQYVVTSYTHSSHSKLVWSPP